MTVKFRTQSQAGILQVLLDEGYITGFSISDDIKSTITVDLKYHQGLPVIEEIARVSRPGCVFIKSNELPKVRGGLGVAIVSTNKGVMTDKAARAHGVGGEVCARFLEVIYVSRSK